MDGAVDSDRAPSGVDAVLDRLVPEAPGLPRNGLVVEGGLVAVDQRQVFVYHICQQLGKLTPLLVQFHSIVHGLLVGLLDGWLVGLQVG